MHPVYSLVPRPARRFGCTKERGGPGMFPHVRDAEGRKVVDSLVPRPSRKAERGSGVLSDIS